MTVEIPVNFEMYVRTAVESGQFQSEEQVVGEALRLLTERDRQREEFRRQVQIGADQLRRGDYTEFDEESLDEFYEQLKAGGHSSENEETP